MKRSTDRILSSHAGNLPRNEALWQMLLDRDAGKGVDELALQSRVRQAVADVVQKQVAAGIDIVNDGEQSKRSWQTYARSRLTGLEERPGERRTPAGSIVGRDMREFEGYFRGALGGAGMPATLRAGAVGGLDNAVSCVGPLRYTGQEQTRADIENLRAALAGVTVEEAVLTAIAPGTIEHWLQNEYYKSDEEFLFAIAEAMNEEYQAITDAGIILQLDEPAIATDWHFMTDKSVAEYRTWLAVQVEALNLALRGIPPERVRMHTCWGSIHHPHTDDIPLEDILDLILQVNVGAYSLEASNPRHDHDWQVWKETKLPDGKILIPGVIGHFTDFVEHPRLVAERIVKYAGVVGRENVIAGVDCGLGTRVGTESILWAKFESLVEGARLASAVLWT
jgi:5-methyltetrahydropteroyltriglutamate--homocysteine methyltransferase